MNKVKILVQGYAHTSEDVDYAASPTSVLIYSNGKKVLVDPGTNAKLLLAGLESEGLSTDNIDILFLTHYHPDHFLNIKLFPKNDIYDGGMIWSDEKEIAYSDVIPGTEIKLLPTPGHSPEHCSLLVETEDGIVCIAQDVFWWEDGNQKSDNETDLLNLEDPFASDKTALLESRKKVLEVSDWIIPGHGKMFKNPRR
jgi:glyoxylase-like metal-dependent hydrolase (beta-lactamase superfamily II)